MTFKIDGVDYSDKVDIAGYTVTPRKVTGGAAGYLLDGSHVADLKAIKTDLKINVVATEQADTSAISKACLKEYVTLEFNDPFTNTNLNDIYEPSIESVSMAIETDSRGKTYWYGFRISFAQK